MAGQGQPRGGKVDLSGATHRHPDRDPGDRPLIGQGTTGAAVVFAAGGTFWPSARSRGLLCCRRHEGHRGSAHVLRHAKYRPPTWRGGGVAEEIPSLRRALERSLRDLGLQKRLKTEQLSALWPKIVGPSVAKIAHPAQFRNGTLFIDVADSVWMQELKFQEGELIGRLNDALREPLVRRLFFQLARLSRAERDPPGEAETAPPA